MKNSLETCQPPCELDNSNYETTIYKFDLGSRTETEKWINPTIYNPSTFIGNTQTILARIEERDNETSSEVGFFSLEDDVLSLIADSPRLKHTQDPYYLGEFRDPLDPSAPPYRVIGGVKISVDKATNQVTDWRDQNYCYKQTLDETVRNGQPVAFLESAHHSKDLRYVQLDDCIAVCPRPQGSFGGIGRVGFFRTENLFTLQADLIEYFRRADESTLIPGMFADDEWGGVNQMLPMPNGSICLIGHRARRDHKAGNDTLRYRPFSCLLDPDSGKLLTTPIELNVSPDDFECVVPKRSYLDDVIFTGGIKLTSDPNKVLFIAGVKDAAVGVKVIPNPLLTYPS